MADASGTWIELNNAISALGRGNPHCPQVRALTDKWSKFFSSGIRRHLQSTPFTLNSRATYYYWWTVYRLAYEACGTIVPQPGLPTPPPPEQVEQHVAEDIEAELMGVAQTIADAGEKSAEAAQEAVLAGLKEVTGSPWPWAILALGIVTIGTVVAVRATR